MLAHFFVDFTKNGFLSLIYAYNKPIIIEFNASLKDKKVMCNRMNRLCKYCTFPIDLLEIVRNGWNWEQDYE